MLGKFIVIEGLEGAGKTTAISTVTQFLRESNINNIILTREPGSTDISEKIREIIQDNSSKEPLLNKAELLLFYAARIQLIENVIKPAINQKKWVIGDRHDLSTRAYQGAGRNIDSNFLELLRNNVLNGFEPNFTLYMDIEPEIGIQRIKQKRQLYRIEKESLDFFKRVRQCYLNIAKKDPNIFIINANQNINKVNNDIYIALSSIIRKESSKTLF